MTDSAEVARVAVCTSCRFSGEPERRSDETGLQCRRRSPLVTGGMMSATQTIWPLVQPNDWCGEYNPHARDGAEKEQ